MSITQVESLSLLASTTLASYAELLGRTLQGGLTAAGTGADFTETQAAAFAERYELLSQRPNVDLNGFSATVKQNADSAMPLDHDWTYGILTSSDAIVIGSKTNLDWTLSD